MWVLHPNGGFYSVVLAAGDTLTIRARAWGDLEDLRDRYLPELTDIDLDTEGDRDYPARAYATRDQWADAVKQMALDIDYGNFKSAVAERQGHERANIYHDVWADLVELEGLAPVPGRTGPWTPE